MNIEKLPLISLNNTYKDNNRDDNQIKKRNKIIDEFVNRLEDKNNKITNNDSIKNSNNNSNNSSDFDIKELQVNEGEIDPFDSTEIEKLKYLKKATPIKNNANLNLITRNEQNKNNYLNSYSIIKNNNCNFGPSLTGRYIKFKFRNQNILLNNLLTDQTCNNNDKLKFKIRNITDYNNNKIDNLKRVSIKKNSENKKKIKRSYSFINIVDNKNIKKIMTSNFIGAQLYLMHTKYLFRKRNFTAKISKINNYFAYTPRNNNTNTNKRITSTINIFNNIKNTNNNFTFCWKNKNKLYDNKILSKKEIKSKLAELQKNNLKNEVKYNSTSRKKNNLNKDIYRINGFQFNHFYG